MTKFCIYEEHGGVCKKTGTYCNLGACLYEDLKEFEVARHGKWILYPDNQSKVVEADDCSVCGAQWLFGERYNYCPSCGAKMDGE